MKIIMLGTGTVTQSLERNASGLLVQTSGLRILVDIGPGIMRRLCEADVDTKLIDAICVTHFHPDHVSDLAPFLFASNYEYGKIRSAPFRLVGPVGLEHFYRGLVQVYGHWIVPTGDRLIVTELDARSNDSLSVDDVAVRSAPAVHSFPSLHYRIEAEGRSLTVSGDTDFSEALVELAEDTDVLICEASLPDAFKQPGHLVPSEAGRIAGRARAKRLILTHFYPPCDHADIIGQASATFSGEVLMAQDLMVLHV
jgi:ribonuclease BN (tRNA processing enzyme)